MKFFAVVLAALVASTTEACDSAKLRREVFDDAGCTKLNEKLTKDYGAVGTQMKTQLHGNCNKRGKMSMRFDCDATAITVKAWGNTGCSGPVAASQAIPFNKCLAVKGTKFYQKLYH